MTYLKIIIPICIILIYIFYKKVFPVIINICNHKYNPDILETIDVMNKGLSRTDITHIYQSLYEDQINDYSNFIKKQILQISFIDLYNLYYDDSIMTRKRTESILANLIYGIYSFDNTNIIIPKSKNCIHMKKALNQLITYYTDTYVMFDDILDLHSNMLDSFNTTTIIHTNKNTNINTNINNEPFNFITNKIIIKSVNSDLSDLCKYIQLYNYLQVDKSFQVIDSNINDNNDLHGLRLFVYISEDMDIVELNNISVASSNVYQRKSAYSLDLDKINGIDVVDFLKYDKIKVYFPFDNLELQNIIKNLNYDNPIIIAQITSLYSTYNYNGTELNGSSRYHNYIDTISTASKHMYSKVTFRKEYLKLSKSIDVDYKYIYKDVYYHILSDAMKVFDFIKDSGLGMLKTIDIQLQDVMTMIAPQLILKYNELDLKPELKFKLIDPVCYPYSFHKIYKTISNDNIPHNNLLPRIRSIRSNVTAMNMLHRLGLVDLYMGVIHIDLDRNTHTYTNIANYPLYDSNIRIEFSSDSKYYVDSTKLRNILQTITKVKFI
jgi:hypothetical protein